MSKIYGQQQLNDTEGRYARRSGISLWTAQFRIISAAIFSANESLAVWDAHWFR